MTVVPIAAANRITDQFLELLKERGITPARDSKLEDEFLSVAELLEIWKDPQRIQGVSEEKQKKILRTAAGVHDFAAKVLAARCIPEFGQFEEHLKLIGKSKLTTS